MWCIKVPIDYFPKSSNLLISSFLCIFKTFHDNILEIHKLLLKLLDLILFFTHLIVLNSKIHLFKFF